MERKIIKCENAPGAIGPYSQGVSLGDLCFFSGQIAIDIKTGVLINGGVEAQTRKILENIGELLKSQSLDYKNVVKTTIFIRNMSEFKKINVVYGEFFLTYPPARSCVEVSALPLDALIEIEVIAAKQ